MRTKFVLAISAALVLNGLASAQGLGGFITAGGLLRVEKVQKEIKLTEDQETKATDAVMKVREKYAEEFQALRELEQAERAKKAPELMKKVSADSEKALAEILKPDQLKRLKQITNQQMGSFGFASADVEKSLKLTADQKSKVKKINNDFQQEMAKARQEAGGDIQAMVEKIGTMRKSKAQEAVALLTPDQKKAWKELTGAPLDLTLEDLMQMRGR